jgi:23S rRNA pseudouridine1911/1915/1917 synthase
MNKTNWKITETETGLRLDKWLAAEPRLGSRAKALAALEKGQIFVDNAEQSPADAGRRMQTGQAVRLWLDRPGSAQRRNYSGAGKRISGLQLVFEDETLLVINKPAGLLTVPLAAQPEAPSLLDRVVEHLRGQNRRQAFIVHRIDRDTSGLVVFAKTFAAQKKLKDQFEHREPERTYWAFVYGHPEPAAGTWQDELVWDQDELKQRTVRASDKQSYEAMCRYRTLEKFAETALLEIKLSTGKRNQIRIQASLRGHALIGERQYLFSAKSVENRPLHKLDFPRQALHALRLGFRHPLDGRKLSFEAPLPADLQNLRQQLKSGAANALPKTAS